MTITIPKIRDFIQGYYNYFRNHLDNESLPKHIREQALYRAMLCTDCLNNGKCTECGCATPAMFFSPLKEDALGRWGKMLDAEHWEGFKQAMNIQLIDNFEDIMNQEIIKRYQFRMLNPAKFIYRGANCIDKMNPAFLMLLDELMDRVDRYLDITMSWTESGYVTHQQGKAVMINVEGTSPLYLFDLLKEAMNLGLSVEIYSDVRIRLMMRETPELFLPNCTCV